jgi:2-keto-4-pentenoate hydratase/2-oxohepta-3-ene-1,7-dioic acid hydratase in catechol pathway
MGPWIVPASEINGQDLAIQCWVNDELRQDGRTFEMIFPIVELISTISAGITLQTGDILATGTPAGEYHECGWG